MVYRHDFIFIGNGRCGHVSNGDDGMKDDRLISLNAAIDALNKKWRTCIIGEALIRDAGDTLKALPPAQQTTLTADDIETIRIHLSAFKEKLCNQGRWTEAAEYERLIQRLTGKGDRTMADERWIPVTERLPENEQDVFVTVEVRLSGRKPFRRVVKAFYTDGKHTDADSAYSWDEFPDPQYDDDDNLIIPEGWWESSDYAEQQGMIDDFVIAWREPLKPWEGGQDNG